MSAINIPSFKEDHISQIPALQVLINLGYEYLTPEEAFKLREENSSKVILEDVLNQQLRTINKIEYKGEKYSFSNNNIAEAINCLKNEPLDGLIRTNERIYDLLSLGKSFEENIQNNRKSYTLRYIDWENPENNLYHVTEEFEVEKHYSNEHIRPDIVLFVNGIPFVVIECKSPNNKEPIEEAISQQIRNQQNDKIPRLFTYSQILLALSQNKAKYATCGTTPEFWSMWKESNIDDSVREKINKPISEDVKNKLFSNRYKYVREYFDAIERNERLVSNQDRTIYSLCRPRRLIELSRKFIVFDAGIKKIARYQQYFAVQNTLNRVKQQETTKKRKGGVIWHTQGSGKSLTMVMLAKTLALDTDIGNSRILLVTDRIDLDKQIKGTFHACGMEPERAKTGEHLLELLEKEKYKVITTVLFKFRPAINKKNREIKTENLFVLVDESHRSQYGFSYTDMQRILPDACYIGFTGTPLMKSEKRSTIEKFGNFIHTYKIDEAVQDKATRPLLYEGRYAEQTVNKASIDTWFQRLSKKLSKEQQAELKRKFTQKDKLLTTELTIEAIAYDISCHFRDNIRGTLEGGAKGQVAVYSRPVALKFKKYFDDIGIVSTEVIFSGPDSREGYDNPFDDEPSEEVHKFWKIMMNKYGNEETYNDQIITSFKEGDYPELLIVVNKLLTGFDAPCNTVLYLAKELKDHTLLQAIARVNRVYPGKDYGFIIDYAGVLENLDKALTEYGSLENFDEEDLQGALRSINDEIKLLPQKYAELKDIFKGRQNKYDSEEYQRFLYKKEIREKFYTKLQSFSGSLGIALSTIQFYDQIDDAQIKKYKDELKFFQKLRYAVKQRYAESLDNKEYEPKVQKLLDTYVSADAVIQLTKQVDIFDKENFLQEVERVVGAAAKADVIAHRTMKTIHEKMDDDPVFYKKFSKLLKQAIDDYRQKRLDEIRYLNQVKEIMDAVINRKTDDYPESLSNRHVAQAFYGIVNQVIESTHGKDKFSKDDLAKISTDIDDIIHDKSNIVDWHLKDDVLNQILNEIEDYLYEHRELNLSFEGIDKIMERIIDVAKRRYA